MGVNVHLGMNTTATCTRIYVHFPSVVLGEKLIWAFQWDMSGIDVNANTKIGRHISTLVKTVTTIGSDLEGRQHLKRARSGTIPTSKPLQPPRVRRSVSAPRPLHIHRRATSLSYPRSPFAPTASVGEGGQETVEDSYTAALEQDLARQTSKVQRMRSVTLCSCIALCDTGLTGLTGMFATVLLPFMHMLSKYCVHVHVCIQC